MYFVYRFLDDNNSVIYVGKSKQDLQQRFSGHTHLPDECYRMVKKIEYIECPTEADMSIKEIYYINKFRNNAINFNILDVTELPITISFDDEWKMYTGVLPSNFSNSINYQEGYTKTQEVRYNKDGQIDKRKSNKKVGISSFVDGFTCDEVNLMVNYYIDRINMAETPTQQKLCFRNLLMFVIGVNLPIKPNVLTALKFKDLFDENNFPKSFSYVLNRTQKDEIIEIPLKEVVKQSLLAYVKYTGMSYQNNASDDLFQSRKHQPVLSITIGRIAQEAASAVGISKNIGAESLRKTYGLNIFHRSPDKLKALLFLGELWGSDRDSSVIKYLNLTEDEIDYDYYLGENFSLCDVDLSKIHCLQLPVTPPKNQMEHPKKTEVKYKPIKPPQKKNRIWSKEQKLKVVNEYLTQDITMKELAKQYGIDGPIVSRWVSAYKQFGEDGLEDKRRNSTPKI